MTYSIVARDPETGEMGVAVQSHWFSVGIVAWGEAGVGVVASQAFADPSYGRLGLDLIRGGKSASAALASLVASDEGASRRQVAMLDADGDVSAHTGDGCIAEASHIVGGHFSVQANMMLRATVPNAMAEAFSSTDAGLVDKLLAALDAAEAEGGDIRGRQSAAILVVGGERGPGGPVMDLRVEDHPEPLVELGRLVGIERAYDHMNLGDRLLAEGDTQGAAELYERAQTAVPDNVEFTFWRGVTLANAGRIDEAKGLLERTFPAPGDWKELLRRLPAAGLLPEDAVDRLID